jgi:hypothetical protein
MAEESRMDIYVVRQLSSRTHCGKSATYEYLIAEYHCGRLLSIPLGKFFTDASALSTLQTTLELVL